MLYMTELTDRQRECRGRSEPAEKKIIVVTFKEQTPEILIRRSVPDPLYEKAFLAPRAEPDHEFDRNTATWD